MHNDTSLTFLQKNKDKQNMDTIADNGHAYIKLRKGIY